MPTDVKNIQQTLDAFESTDLQRKNQRQSSLVPIGAATKAIGSTLRQIKAQKDANRAQGIIDRAKAVKQRLDLMLQDKTAEEKEQVFASSNYLDAYQGLINEATALGGDIAGATQGAIGSIQQSTKLKHLSGLMTTMAAERKERVKESLTRFRARVATNPDQGQAAAADAKSSMMMLLQSDAQREEYRQALKKNFALGALEGFTNKGPNNSPRRALEMLDDPDIAKYLTDKQMRTYRNYISSQLKDSKNKAVATRNDILGYAANTGDFSSIMHSLKEPELDDKTRKQLKNVIQVAQAQTLRARPVDEDTVNKVLIKNPQSKDDRDYNEKTRAAFKKLGEMYTANPIDAVLSVMGPEYETELGYGDVVADVYGSRLSSNRAAEVATDALEALENGTHEAYAKNLQDKYRGVSNSVMLESINRHYYGKTGVKAQNERAALIVSYNSALKGMFKPEAVSKVLAANPKPATTAYIPQRIMELRHTLSDDEYAATVRMMQAQASLAAEEKQVTGSEQKGQKYSKETNYNDSINEVAGFMESKVVDLQREVSWWPDPMNGLLKDGKSVKLPPDIIGSMTIDEARRNRDSVRQQLTVANLKRFAVNFDESTNNLLNDAATQIYLKRDPRSDGMRFNVVMSSPTGVAYDPGLTSFEKRERQENLLTQADGQVFQVSAAEIYKHGSLMPSEWEREPEDVTLWDMATTAAGGVYNDAKRRIFEQLFNIKEPEQAAAASFDVRAADRQRLSEEAIKNLHTLPTQKQNPAATLYNLKTHHERAWQQEVRPALLANDSKWKGAAAKIPLETRLNLMKAIAYIESNFDPKATSEKKAEGIFQLHGVNKRGIDTRNTKQAAGRAIEVMSDAYNLAKRVADKTRGATEQDTIILAARIYNGGRSFAVDEKGRLQTDTMKRIMRGASSITKGGKHENVTYANKLYKLFGFTKRLKATPGTDEAIPILEPEL